MGPFTRSRLRDEFAKIIFLSFSLSSIHSGAFYECLRHSNNDSYPTNRASLVDASLYRFLWCRTAEVKTHLVPQTNDSKLPIIYSTIKEFYSPGWKLGKKASLQIELDFIFVL